MPYISKEKRKKLDWIVDNLAAELIGDNGITGNLNYVLFRLAKKLCHRYKDYAAFVADLECSKLEIYRKLTAPYEEIKEEENGSISP